MRKARKAWKQRRKNTNKITIRRKKNTKLAMKRRTKNKKRSLIKKIKMYYKQRCTYIESIILSKRALERRYLRTF